VRDQWQDFGFNQIKNISDKLYVRGKNLESTRINVLKDEDTGDVISVGTSTLWKKLLTFLGVGTTIDATTISIEIVGETTNAQAYLREIEIPSIDVRANYTV